jgi:hypothetical protein
MRVKFLMTTLSIVALLAAALAYEVAAQDDATPTPEPMSGMGQMSTEFLTDDLAPLVRGIYEGEDIFFIHTEVSDPDIAQLLTDMMGPQVVTVSSLAEIPEYLLGSVYVFTNGITGGGPLGFQPDIFDSVPGDEGYTPLRAIKLITWQEDAAPRQLNNVEEVEAAEAAGEILIESPGVVANMPILAWHDDSR